ncbi:MAG: hypothetical protein ACM3W7_01180 [Acidobacteriota bacterium]
MMLPATVTNDHLERIQLPDVSRPEQTPSWPAWVALRIDSIKTEHLRDTTTGRWKPTPTLPSHLVLKASEREMLELYVEETEKLCNRTPVVDPDATKEMLAVLTKMMITLHASAQSELTAEARGEVFLEALEDLPPWAVRAAVRCWNRGECGRNEKSQNYDYHWCPAPAELRQVALAELNRVKVRAHQAKLLLRAVPREECSDEHRRRMCERLTELSLRLRTSLVGSNGSGGGSAQADRVLTVGRSQGTARPEA